MKFFISHFKPIFTQIRNFLINIFRFVYILLEKPSTFKYMLKISYIVKIIKLIPKLKLLSFIYKIVVFLLNFLGFSIIILYEGSILNNFHEYFNKLTYNDI